VSAGTERLRADAARNRARILSAAAAVFVEMGPDAPLEEVVARAGLGFGTLYRRFPDRAALQRAVVIDVMTRLREIAEAALADPTPWPSSLARYLHDALDLQIGIVVPMLLDRVDMNDPEIAPLRGRDAALVNQMIERAQAEGTLRPDVGFADVSLLLIRLSRPLPGGFAPERERELAHRHLQIVLDGLAGKAATPLPGPTLSLADLRKQAAERLS